MSAVQKLNTPIETSFENTVQSDRPRLLTILTIVSVISLAFGIFLSFAYAPLDIDQGDVQRIFYLHMPSFFGAFLAFGATVVGGIQYLRTRNNKWDTLALAGVEVGLLMGIVNLVTGAIWARPIWNTWWTWDPRLTSDAVMILTYAAYLMLRSGIENPDTRRRFASVYGILAFTTVIVTLMIIRVTDSTIHPAVVGTEAAEAEGGFDMPAPMAITLIYNLVIWLTIIPITLMWYRIRLENAAERVNAMKLELLTKE